MLLHTKIVKCRRFRGRYNRAALHVHDAVSVPVRSHTSRANANQTFHTHAAMPICEFNRARRPCRSLGKAICLDPRQRATRVAQSLPHVEDARNMGHPCRALSLRRWHSEPLTFILEGELRSSYRSPLVVIMEGFIFVRPRPPTSYSPFNRLRSICLRPRTTTSTRNRGGRLTASRTGN